jgi:hypothetical protein
MIKLIGQPILVEYNADGTEGSVVSLPSDYQNRVRELQIISATEYHKEKERLETYQEQYSTSIASGATLMTRQQFEQGTYPTADGKVNSAPPKLPAYAKSVLVRGRTNRILNEPSELVLLNFSVDLTQHYPVAEMGSVVLNPDGQIIASSPLNIAPRVGFFGDPNQKQISNSIFRKRDDQIFGPVVGVPVQVNEVFPGGMDVTNSEGKYTFALLLPPCPGFDFEWSIDVYANLHYTGFNPNGSATLPYVMRRQSWSMCMGIHALMLPFGAASYNEIEANSMAARDMQTLDFRVDVMFVSGRLLIGNKDTGPIPVGNATEYQVTAPDNSLITQTLYDFDNDGKPDTSTLGEMVEKTLEDGSKTKVFEAKEDGKLQAVYFSSRKETNPEQPDVIRQADTKKNFQANGLLTSISKDDFKKTDILIFRESTGQLVLERRGMSDSDMNSRRDADVAKDNAFYYRLMLRGPTDSQLNVGGGITRNGSWEEWSSQYKMTEPFQKRESDHLKSGEWIRVVAINRATGYMATQRTQLQDASQNEGGALNVPLNDMTLMPPNLKVWAERSYEVEDGLTKGEDRHYLVGAEGAALTSDTYIRVYTEWLDEEGRALPEDLGKDNGEQYGLTGRLAKVATENVLTPVSGFSSTGSDLANFPIAPGRNTQVLRLNDNLTTPEHFYIHVSGTQKDESPDFGTGTAEGILATRPEKITPFLAPLYDENKDWKTWNAYRDLKREQASQETPVPEDEKPIKPLPTYVWGYRPEYQFSQYQLELEEINRVTLNEQGQEVKTNILDSKTPLISSTDELIDVLYSLFGNDNPRLDPIDGPQDLVLALGEEELKLQLGEDKQIRFENIEHLASLTPEDFLTLRLYTNQDAGNILWEYAYLHLSVGLTEETDWMSEGVVYVNADEPEIKLDAAVIGYPFMSEESKKSIVSKVQWRIVSGSGNVNPVVAELDETGVATTTLRVVPSLSNKVVLEASILGDESTKARSFTFGVMAGKPHSISLSTSGTAALHQVGTSELNAVVRDKQGNIVNEGTGVSFRETGHVTLKKYSGLTNQGKASATFVGGGVSGSFPVTVRSGNAEATTNIEVVTLPVDIPSMPTTMIAGQIYPLTAVIDSSLGAIPNSTYLDLGVNAGAIIDRDIDLTNGMLHFKYQAPQKPGNYTLAVKADLNSPKLFNFEVIKPVSQTKEMDEYYLVSGVQSGSTLPIENYLGQASSINVRTSAQLILQGTPGTSWELQTDNKYIPNREPKYFSRFEVIRFDENRLRSASFNNVQRETGPHPGIYSLAFVDDQSYWKISESQDVSDIVNPSYNFWLLPESPGKILSIDNDLLTLTYENNQLRADLQLASSTESLVLPIVNPLNWNAVATGVRDGNFYLVVGDQEVSRAVVGSKLGVASPNVDALSLGSGFKGKLAGLRIYDWQSSPVINLPTGGVYDASGKALVNIELNSYYKNSSTSLPAVTVAIQPVNEDPVLINVLSKNMVSEFASAFVSAESTPAVHTDDVLQAMPMIGIFPDKRRGAVGLTQRFALRSNTEAAAGNVIASLAWLSQEPRYVGLHQQVRRLQQTFINNQYPQFAEYAAEYLQEASVKASYGDPFWLRAMATGLTVWAELAEIRPETATLVAKSIKNRKDFWLWIRIMGLPANGWITASIPVPHPDRTCDQVTPDVNVGTLMEFSSESCRATGGQMAAMLEGYIAVDGTIRDEPELLTKYMIGTLSIIREMPLQYKKLFPPADFVVAQHQEGIIEEANAILPYVIRGLAITLRQMIRKGSASAPENFIAFMQGGTNARVSRAEMLIAMAYLGSRLGGVECNGCKNLNPQVSETVIQDMATWMAGLGLSKNGVIHDEDIDRKACLVSGNSHGKAFELVATAAYHSLFEFGRELGLANSDRYEIILKDPRAGDDPIYVPLMYKELEKYKHTSNSPHQRKPDLVMKGEGDQKRLWVELKSWRYNNYLEGAKTNPGNNLKSNLFPLWDGNSKSDTNKDGKSKGKYTFNAHRQYFLDFAASRDALLSEYWEDGEEDGRLNKPSQHRTWFQVWEPGKRKWKKLERVNGKYKLTEEVPTINVATPWIGKDDVVAGIVRSTTPQFRALQDYLTSAPMSIRPDVYLATIGKPLSQHKENFQQNEITHSFSDFSKAHVLPYTVKTFYVLELGERNAKLAWKKMAEGFGNKEFAELESAIQSGEISEVQIEALQEKLTAIIEELLGPVKYLTVRIPLLSDVEDYAADQIIGDELDSAREAIAEQKLPESFFENACEEP